MKFVLACPNRTFIPPLLLGLRTPALPAYLFFAMIETAATSAIVWQAWNWSAVKARFQAGAGGQ
jgi:hypothetical protein